MGVEFQPYLILHLHLNLPSRKWKCNFVTGPTKNAMKHKLKTKPFRHHEEATIESFRNDPEFAAEYLNAILADGDREELLLALRYMANAFGGVTKLAEKAELNATSLYRTLSQKGNPELKSLTALLKVMGMRLAVQPLNREN